VFLVVERERERDFGWLSRGDVGTDALLSSFLRGMLLKGKGFWFHHKIMIKVQESLPNIKVTRKLNDLQKSG
jgi:hypothetical protein